MNIHPLFISKTERQYRNTISKNPRKLQITGQRDRMMAAVWLRNARVQAQHLRVWGYDRQLIMAAVHAHLGGDDHIARMFNLAALD